MRAGSYTDIRGRPSERQEGKQGEGSKLIPPSSHQLSTSLPLFPSLCCVFVCVRACLRIT